MEGLCVADSCVSQATNLLLLSILDSESADNVRNHKRSIANWIGALSTEYSGLKPICVGGTLSKTSLSLSPTGTNSGRRNSEQIELTLFYDKAESPQCDKWYLSLYEALCIQSSEDRSCMDSEGPVLNRKEMKNATVERVSFFPKEKSLEAVVDGTLVTIKSNNISSLAFASMLEDANACVGNDSLLKRSILLVRAWCNFEAPSIQIGQDKSDDSAVKDAINTLLGDRVIETMLMWLFSSNIMAGSTNAGTEVLNPFQVLLGFLNVFSRFEWNKWAISITGAIALPGSSSSYTGDCLSSEMDESSIQSKTSSPPSCDPSVRSIPVPVTGNTPLCAMACKVRARLGLSLQPQYTVSRVSSSRQSGETDEEDASCDSEVNDKKTTSERSRANSKPAFSFNERTNDNCTSMCILDPTHAWTNLCDIGTKSTKLATQIRCSTVKRILSAGLSGLQSILYTIQETENTNTDTESASCAFEGSDRIMRVVSETFPTLSKSIVVKDPSVLRSNCGATISSLLSSDVEGIEANFRLAESTLKMKISATMDTNTPTATPLPVPVPLPDGSSHLRSLLHPNSCVVKGADQESVYEVSPVATTRSVKEYKDQGDSETASEGGSTTPSAFSHREAQEGLENRGLSDRTISKSFSSFESDQGSGDFFINLPEGQMDQNMRAFSQFGSPLLSRESSGRDPMSYPLGYTGVRTPSSGITNVGPDGDDRNAYYLHQKTLQRRSQNITSGQAPPNVSSTRPPTSVSMKSTDSPHEYKSLSPLQTISKHQSPITVPSPPLKPPTPPFIQPFVVKEMQVWVPGKFGASTASTPAVSKTPPLPINGAKQGFKGGYPNMGSSPGSHQGASPPTAGRYSPVPSAHTRPSNNSYMYPPPEEEFDVNWVDHPEEGNSRMRANRMALAGHHQMQGQLGRGQSQTQRLDHHSNSPYPGSRASRSPLSDQGSTSSTSPLSHSLPGHQSKRLMAPNTSAFIAQTNRLNYNANITNNNSSSMNGLMKSSSSPLLQGHRDLHRDASPMMREGSPSTGMGMMADTSDFDNWSLSSQQHSSQLLRQQQYPQSQSQSMHNVDGPFPSSQGSGFSALTRGISAERESLLDHMWAAQQQRLSMGVGMGVAEEKSRAQMQSAALQREKEWEREREREKSEAQLPSFLRDL